MKVDLLYLPVGKSPFRTAVAYVVVGESGRYGDNENDPRHGKIMLTSESTSEAECHKQIDHLISDLNELKNKVSRKFRNSATETLSAEMSE